MDVGVGTEHRRGSLIDTDEIEHHQRQKSRQRQPRCRPCAGQLPERAWAGCDGVIAMFLNCFRVQMLVMSKVLPRSQTRPPCTQSLGRVDSSSIELVRRRCTAQNQPGSKSLFTTLLPTIINATDVQAITLLCAGASVARRPRGVNTGDHGVARRGPSRAAAADAAGCRVCGGRSGWRVRVGRLGPGGPQRCGPGLGDDGGQGLRGVGFLLAGVDD